jgi:ribosomal protein S6--L-glutamate ligase
MLRLAVTARAETFDRLRDPLAARDIEVAHLPKGTIYFDYTR